MGRVRIADPDVANTTDLHRQILFTEDDVTQERPKVLAARQRLGSANSECEIESMAVGFDAENAEALLDGMDLVVDCTDDFETRMLINEACLELATPWVHGACAATAGIVIPFAGRDAACYRCVVDHIPEPGVVPTTEETGILGPAAGATGSIQAAEAIKLLVDPGLVRQRIIYFDSLSNTYQTIDSKRKPDCPACAGRRYEFFLPPAGS
jgi:adenylyltransferase/sulfurtransferase